MARERRLFSEEFKREAVKLVGQPGASKVAIARDLGIGANLLGRWCREANVDLEVPGGHPTCRPDPSDAALMILLKTILMKVAVTAPRWYFSMDLNRDTGDQPFALGSAQCWTADMRIVSCL